MNAKHEPMESHEGLSKSMLAWMQESTTKVHGWENRVHWLLSTVFSVDAEGADSEGESIGSARLRRLKMHDREPAKLKRRLGESYFEDCPVLDHEALLGKLLQYYLMGGQVGYGKPGLRKSA